MKATLKFNLPEEQEDLDLARHGKDLWCMMFELTQFLRRKVNKGEHDYKTADEALVAIWKHIWEDSGWDKLSDIAS